MDVECGKKLPVVVFKPEELKVEAVKQSTKAVGDQPELRGVLLQTRCGSQRLGDARSVELLPDLP